MFSRNFELVLTTVLKYDGIFSDQERERIQGWIDLTIPCKTLYSRMFFRRRYWYTIRQLKNYSEHSGNIDQTLQKLNETGFLKNDQDSINEFDYERLQELFETMVSMQIKQVEVDVKKCIRGYCPDNLDKEYDLISNNPYFLMKETFSEGVGQGIYHQMCKKLSHKMSGWLRESTEETIRSGKKVNVFLNYQVTDKVKLI